MTTNLPHISRRFGRVATAIISCLLLTTMMAIFAAPQAHAARVSKVERAELVLINRYRVVHGLPRLKMDRKLTRAADWMAADMPAHNRFAHVDSLGRSPFDRLALFGYPSNTWRGENLAAGNVDPLRTFIQWRNSPPHRANMLNGHYRAIGISRVCVADSQYHCYWVTEFGSRVVKRIR